MPEFWRIPKPALSNMNQIPSKLLRQLLLIVIIAALFGMLFWNLRFFVPALLGAYTLYVLLRGPLFFLTERHKWSPKLALPVLIIGSFVAIMLPIFWVVTMLRQHVIGLFQNSDSLRQNAEQLVQRLEIQYNVSLLTTENMRNLTDWLVQTAQNIIGATVNGLGLVAAMYIILAFMLADGKNMERLFFNWLPLRPENVEYVREHLNSMVWSNALGIPLMGVVQGLAAGLVYWLAGVENPWLWVAVTFVAGMLPVVGAALAYVPLSLILLANGMAWKALFIFLYGFIVVGSVDNIARMWVLKKIGQTHPLTTLFGVIAGVKLFGFIGFIFGPIMISVLVLLVKIYDKEFNEKPDKIIIE